MGTRETPNTCCTLLYAAVTLSIRAFVAQSSIQLHDKQVLLALKATSFSL